MATELYIFSKTQKIYQTFTNLIYLDGDMLKKTCNMSVIIMDHFIAWLKITNPISQTMNCHDIL